MKIWKKNVVAAAVLVTVCSGIYLNWLYTADQPQGLTQTLDAQKLMDDSLVVMKEDAPSEEAEAVSQDYFAAVRLSRQQARDHAVGLLQEAMAYGEASDSSASAENLDEIVQTALSEAQIESLVVAKGYRDCVAYMNDDGISVAVAAPEGGLQQADVAVITDIILGQSDYDLTAIRVVEVE